MEMFSILQRNSKNIYHHAKVVLFYLQPSKWIEIVYVAACYCTCYCEYISVIQSSQHVTHVSAILKTYLPTKIKRPYVRHPMGVLHSFSMRKQFYDKMDLTLFHFHVTIQQYITYLKKKSNMSSNMCKNQLCNMQ